jgi:hypothetical protein
MKRLSGLKYLMFICVALADTSEAKTNCLNSRGTGTTDRMTDCALRAPEKDRQTANVINSTSSNDDVEFVLTFSGGMGAGISRPPPQRLRIPKSMLNPATSTSTARDSTGAIQAGSVAINLPYVVLSDIQGLPAMPQQVTVGITAAGWQKRSRESLDPDVAKMPWHKKLERRPFELVPVFTDDPSAYERIYITEDARLGFVGVNCFGYPQMGSRGCRISAELSTYLVLSIYLPEDQLFLWRALLVKAGTLANKMRMEH